MFLKHDMDNPYNEQPQTFKHIQEKEFNIKHQKRVCTPEYNPHSKFYLLKVIMYKYCSMYFFRMQTPL